MRALLLVLVAACGSGVHRDPAADAPGTCAANGGGHITGTVAGQALVPMSAHARIATAGASVISLDEPSAATCTTAAATGRSLRVTLPSVTVGTMQGTFSLVDNASGDAQPLGPGSVTIESVTADCVAGTFDLTSGADHATGAFGAVVCR